MSSGDAPLARFLWTVKHLLTISETLDKHSEIWYNEPCKGSEKQTLIHLNPMLYTIYDNNEILRGQFKSIYDLERFIDSIRRERGEQFPNTPRTTPFEYVKSIGWYWEIADNLGVDNLAASEV